MNEIQTNPDIKKKSIMKKLLALVMSSKRNKIIAAIIAAVIVIVAVVIVAVVTSQNRDIPAVVSTTLEKTVKIEELQTVQFPCSGVATKYSEPENEGGEPQELYYVSYEGMITAGVNFKAVKTTVNEEEKKVIVTVPSAEIQSLDIDESSLEFIFNDKKSGKDERIINEATILCNEDLKNNTDAINEVIKIAQDNAFSAVEALVKPILDALGDDYTWEIK